MKKESLLSSDKYYIEAMSFYHCGKIAQCSGVRCDDEQLLFSPINYLFRHSIELLLKALIIREAEHQYAQDINEISFPPHNRKLSSMHSLKALFDTWKELFASLLYWPIVEKELSEISKLINEIDAFDPISTFFRYPYDKKGNENHRDFLEDVDLDSLSSVPCSIGNIIYHEGVENFSHWNSDEQFMGIEFDLVALISKLSDYYSGENLLDSQ